jgi:hypothetical protein
LTRLRRFLSTKHVLRVLKKFMGESYRSWVDGGTEQKQVPSRVCVTVVYEKKGG